MRLLAPSDKKPHLASIQGRIGPVIDIRACMQGTGGRTSGPVFCAQPHLEQAPLCDCQEEWAWAVLGSWDEMGVHL